MAKNYTYLFKSKFFTIQVCAPTISDARIILSIKFGRQMHKRFKLIKPLNHAYYGRKI